MLFIQRVVTAEQQAPHRSFINLAVWPWPAARRVQRAALSDHPPRGAALVCSLCCHLLLFLPPPLHSVAAVQLLCINGENILIDVS